MQTVDKQLQAAECLGRLSELLASSPANMRCTDCDKPNPEWTSQGFGTFICLNCAGYHRSIGAHVTTVRSLTLDEWTPDQVAVLEQGGNERFIEYLRNCKVLQRYHLPEVVYYTEVLKARIQQREPREYVADEWTGLVRPVHSPSSGGSGKTSDKSASAVSSPTGTEVGQQGGFTSSVRSVKSNPIAWVDDSLAKACMVCTTQFSLIQRKHHCRRCGKVVCKQCAPKDNARPILEWGLKEPVRHCKVCFRSPSVTWKD